MGCRRTGCLTCRKRKIRCDERRPTCLHCEKSSRDCVGWASRFQLEYQPISRGVSPALPRLPLKFKEPLFKVPKRHPSQRLKGGKTLLSRGKSPRLSDAKWNVLPGPNRTLSTLTPFPFSPAEKLAGKVVDLIENGSTCRFNVLYFGAYFQELPILIGTSACLDSAVECFLLAQQRLGTPKSEVSNGLLKRYGKSLKLLQIELEALQPQKRTEALAVAVILLTSEIIDDSLSTNSHFAHADGACAILRICGPDGFNSKFELQLFYSLVPIIVSRCLEQNTTCFLFTPEWLALLDKVPSQWTSTRIEARILHSYTQMPAFLQAIRKWRNSPFTDIPREVLRDILSLRHHLIELGKEIAETIRISGLILELPYESKPPGPSSYYVFGDVRLADCLSIFFRMVILVARGLSQLHLMQPCDREWASLAAMQLCMSVKHRDVHTPVEAFFESLVLRVARLASSQDLANWIEIRLQQVDLWMDRSLKKVIQWCETWLDIEAIPPP